MAVVVSDTSPMRALAHLGQLGLLQVLYGQILLPPAVAWELLHPSGGLPLVDVSQIAFVQVQSPQDQFKVNQLLQTLDLGESEALVLAAEVQATAILIDEKAGRSMAHQLGLQYTGTLGVLVQAKQNGLLPSVRPLIDSLVNNLKFFVSPKLRADVLQQAGESP